ncbi:hypothetical protein GGQ68_000451 [Sagittula marina]|uniref:Uncharacterized protein n=1 Tax=Sagittula marina TaxID=943940 RepID=A0A7W6GQS2_9RHOB|nr:hypothetical protein [Sagittula marina]MBB3984140.1 hypothetical protein [Sagittula marina]
MSEVFGLPGLAASHDPDALPRDVGFAVEEGETWPGELPSKASFDDVVTEVERLKAFDAAAAQEVTGRSVDTCPEAIRGRHVRALPRRCNRTVWVSTTSLGRRFSFEKHELREKCRFRDKKPENRVDGIGRSF